MKNFLSSWKVKMSMVGGVIILTTAYGTCSFDPDEEAIKEKVEEAVKGEKEEVPPIPKEEVDKIEGPKEAVEEKEVDNSSEE